MKEFISRHPFLFSFGIFVADALVPIPFVIAFKLLNLDIEPLRLIVPVAQSCFVLGVIYYLGWFRATGFSKRIHDINVLWFPVALAFVPILMFGTVGLRANVILFYTTALIFTGIDEEGIARGIVLKAMLPKGKWVALIFMAVLFSTAHFSNLFFEDFSALEMMEKLLVTFGFAILYGAVFLRTLNIWPLIVIHTLHDLVFLISGTAGPYTVRPFPSSANVLIAAISIAYSLYIVRDVSAEKVLEETGS
jgi:membrane protease YdiL (CAAX protease family)